MNSNHAQKKTFSLKTKRQIHSFQGMSDDVRDGPSDRDGDVPLLDLVDAKNMFNGEKKEIDHKESVVIENNE